MARPSRLRSRFYKHAKCARAALPLARYFAGRVGFAWSGQYRVLALAPSAATVCMFTLRPGAMFNHSLAALGLEPGDGTRLVADQGGLLLTIEARPFAALMDASRALAQGFAYELASLNVAYAQRLYEIAALGTRALLQAELLRLAERGRASKGEIIVADAPTQSALAAQLGLSREAVTRNLRLLVKDGLVRVERTKLIFPNLEKMRADYRRASGANLVRPRAEAKDGLGDQSS